jgi:hypothetical protein
MTSQSVRRRITHDDAPSWCALIGTVCCRLESKNGAECLYLMTMGVLAVRANSVSLSVRLIDWPAPGTAIPQSDARRSEPSGRIGRGRRELETADRLDLSPCAVQQQ